MSQVRNPVIRQVDEFEICSISSQDRGGVQIEVWAIWASCIMSISMRKVVTRLEPHTRPTEGRHTGSFQACQNGPSDWEMGS